MESKSGIKTTEFKLTVVALIVVGVVVIAGMFAGYSPQDIAEICLTVIAPVMGYQVSRGVAKIGAKPTPTPVEGGAQ